MKVEGWPRSWSAVFLEKLKVALFFLDFLEGKKRSMSLGPEPEVIYSVGHIFNLFISCFAKVYIPFLLTA